MPLVNPRILTYFLNHYLTERQPEWNSLMGKAETLLWQNNALRKSSECVKLNNQFYNEDKSSLANSLKWNIYRRVVILDNEPQKTDLASDTLGLYQKDGQVTVYWVENNEKMSKSLALEAVTAIIQQLPKEKDVKESQDLPLIKNITSIFGCYEKVVDAWAKLLWELGGPNQSQLQLASAKHAIRTYAFKIIKESEIADAFAAYVEILRRTANIQETEILQLDKAIRKLKAENASESIIDAEIKKRNETEEKYFENLLHMADLGDKEAIVTAAEKGLFSGLSFPNIEKLISKDDPNLRSLIHTFNVHLPFDYQDNYFLIHYQTHCRDCEKRSFEEFIAKTDNLPVDIKLPESGSGILGVLSGVLGSVQTKNQSSVNTQGIKL